MLPSSSSVAALKAKVPRRHQPRGFTRLVLSCKARLHMPACQQHSNAGTSASTSLRLCPLEQDLSRCEGTAVTKPSLIPSRSQQSLERISANLTSPFYQVIQWKAQLMAGWCVSCTQTFFAQGSCIPSLSTTLLLQQTCSQASNTHTGNAECSARLLCCCKEASPRCCCCCC